MTDQRAAYEASEPPTDKGPYQSVAPVVLRASADALPLADASVDLIVTSPPYFGLRSYTDGGEHYAGQVGDEASPAAYLDRLLACTAEWMRVLRPSGSLFVNLGDKYGPAKSLGGLPWRYALRCCDDLGLTLRAEVIWSKPNGLPESVTDRVRRSHEQVFHLTKQPTYFASVDEVREAHATVVTSSGAVRYRRDGEEVVPRVKTANAVGNKYVGGGLSGALEGPAQHALGKLPSSVWVIPSARLTVPASLGVDHFAAYPPELVRRIVLGWSPPTSVVLDPFGGTGTTALVASCYGRTGISVDLSHDYSRLAQWRTTDPGERARVLHQPKPDPVHPGQGDLFGDAA